MKLICCSSCNQIFNLGFEYQECKGGHGGGQYVDGLNAKIWGPKDKIFVLGFANSSFIDALRKQLHEGDSTEMMRYAGLLTPKGRDFTAFIIPDAANSIERVDEKFPPLKVNPH